MDISERGFDYRAKRSGVSSARRTLLAVRRRNPIYRDLKIFAVSGTPQSECGVPTGRQGVDRWFSKPINPRQLVDEMNRDLGVANVPA